MRKNTQALIIIACILYCISAIMLLKGHDKMTQYYNSEKYPDRNINAYVGGDAYNYIINGNYATGFFVLSMGFITAGTILVGTAVIINAIPDPSSKETDIVQTSSQVSNELPDL